MCYYKYWSRCTIVFFLGMSLALSACGVPVAPPVLNVSLHRDVSTPVPLTPVWTGISAGEQVTTRPVETQAVRRPTAVPNPAAMAPTPTIAPPREASARLQPLLAELESLLEGWEGKHAVSVTDLQTGETISVNGSRQQLAACTIKIPIMIAVAQDIESGRYSAGEVEELVKAAMGPSYTPPARELLRLVGQGDIGAGVHRVNAILREFGARGSILTHPPGYPQEEYGYKASHGIDENLLTTNDLNLLLSRLYRRELLSDWATGYVLQSLTIAPDWMDTPLRAHLPSSARVYHKIGQLYEPENVWNDAGIVVHEADGRKVAYAISYLGSYGESWREAYARETEIAAIVWSYFGGDALAALDGSST